MHWAQIIGFSLITIGTFFSFCGSFKQARKDETFQNNLEEYVTEQREVDIPTLEGLRIEGKDFNSYSLIVKNTGNRTAKKVKLLYQEDSYPSIFQGNMISGAEEIPQGVEYSLPMYLFSFLQIAMSVPNNEDYKAELKAHIDDFNSGEKLFIPRFHLEYFHEDEKITSETYVLTINKNGLVSLSKEGV